jgi:hypothetical protein
MGVYGFEVIRFLSNPDEATVIDLVLFVCCFPALVVLALTCTDIQFLNSSGVILNYNGEYWMYPVFWGLSIIDMAFIIASTLASMEKLPSQFKNRLYAEESID